MNIFYLHENPEISAKMHCDKHVVKMIIEYAQLMSTAHRILDGDEYEGRTKIGRRIRRWKHPNKNVENTIYKASHINHPSAVWARESVANYVWLYNLFEKLCDEYTFRYGKVHSTDSLLRDLLSSPPTNIICIRTNQKNTLFTSTDTITCVVRCKHDVLIIYVVIKFFHAAQNQCGTCLLVHFANLFFSII